MRSHGAPRATPSWCCWRNPTSPKVSDPAAGSGGIETLTQQLCEAAWSLFQEIEKAGGMFAALEQGLIQRRVAATRAVREANIARRKEVLTGATEFPNLHEAQVAVLDAKPVVLRALWRSQDKIRSAAADATGGTVRTAARPLGPDPEKIRRASKNLPRQSRHARRLHRRAPPLPRAFSRPAGSRRSIPRDLPIRPRWPTLSRRPAPTWPACARPTRSMPRRRRRPRRPFKTPGQGISIWQAGRANRKPRSAPQALMISSSPAATRSRPCRTPGSEWSKHDVDRETRSDRRLPMRRGSLCAVGAARQGQHLPLPDVPEGVRRAVRVLRRYRTRRFHLDARASRPRSSPPRSPSAISAGIAAPRSAYRLIDGPRIEIMTGALRPPGPGGADLAIWNRIPARLGGRRRQPAEQDHAAELRRRKSLAASSATSIRTMIEVTSTTYRRVWQNARSFGAVADA